jgi:VIT1/CCC1 family predicted Fe2+/Mn2+ transporter
MDMVMPNPLHTASEIHLVSRIAWLRAAVLGANDGIVSTASLIIGVAAAAAKPTDILLTGVAGLVAGAMSMAAGEYVSVSSQADTERADLARERLELETDILAEEAELQDIYVRRGLTPDLARQVAAQLMRKDALAAHAHDELGLVPGMHARPVQAALTSAATFAAGAAMPLIAAAAAPRAHLIPIVALAALAFLATLGAVGGRTGGASVGKAMLRVSFWGALAMTATWAVGLAFGTRAA